MRSSAVVPSLGRSSWAAEAVARLADELAPVGGEILWVAPREAPPPAAAGSRLRWLRLDEPAGFAVAVNRGILSSDTEFVAVVNDDAIVEPGWLELLTAELVADPRLAAVQGVVAELQAPGRCDGCGLAWNSWWQAVQLGHGGELPHATAPAFEPFGVSATAALFRRSALDAVSRPGRAPFDERLGNWYEDVELAVRLRAAGFSARTLPAARAVHAGSATGKTMPRRRQLLLARNRLLVVLRLLGRRAGGALPSMLARDVADGARALLAGQPAAAAVLAAGWLWAALSAPRYARLGPPLLPAGQIGRPARGHPAAPLSTSRAEG